MTNNLEPNAAQEEPRFGYAEFACNPCNRAINISTEGALLLADDKSIRCPLCRVSIKAMPYDQARLRQVTERVGYSMSSSAAFLAMWFVASLLVALFVNTQISVIMTSVGLLISYAFKEKPPVIDNVIHLDREM
ncbi:hypothetical protein SB766_06745 [Pseudomonas sp. SIMBA_077]